MNTEGKQITRPARQSREKPSPIIIHATLLLAALLLLCIFILSLSVQITTFFPVDDAYISFRYAENWSNGFGPVFNVGERVEGYSNFLWVALLAIAAKSGLTPPLAARLFSILAIASITWLLLWTVSTRGGLRGRTDYRLLPVAVLSALVVLMSPHTTLNVLSGLEVPIAALFLLAGVVLMTRRNYLGAPPLFLLFSLTRPEAILISVAVWAAFLYWQDHSERRKGVLAAVFGLVVPYGIYLAWRLAFYGDLLPNSVSAKMGAGLLQQLPGSFTYIMEFMRFYWLLVPFAVASILLADNREALQTRRLILSAITMVLLLTLLTGSGDPYRSFGRYLFPIVPLLAWLSALGARDIYSYCRLSFPQLKFVVLAAIVSAFLAQQYGMIHPALIQSGVNSGNFQTRAENGFSLITTQDHEPHLEGRPREDLNLYFFAAWLLTHSSPTDLLATGEVGIAPYYSGIQVLDTFGLVDKTIAHLPGGPGQKMDTDYVFGRKPEFFSMKVDPSCICGGTPADNQILTHWRLQRDYDLVRIIPAGYAKLLLFQRREQPAFEVYYDFAREFNYDRVEFVSTDGESGNDAESARDYVRNESVMMLMTEAQKEQGMRSLAPAEALSSSDFASADSMRDWLGYWRKLLYHHPYTNDTIPEVHYQIPVPANAVLQFGIGMVAEFWDSHSGDGVQYEIKVIEENGSESTIFSQYIDPKNNPQDQGWQDFKISLTPWENRNITLVFATSPGPDGDNSNDFGGWGQPLVLIEGGSE